MGSQRFPQSEVEVENLVSSFICVGSDTQPNATAELPAIRQVLPECKVGVTIVFPFPVLV